MSISCTHCWASHPQDEHRVGTHTGCPTCRVTFYSKSAFRRHMQDPISHCSPRAVTEFRCLDCDREFRSASSLYTHLAKRHPNFREPPPDRRGLHYCEECRKNFDTSTALKSHRAHARVHRPLLARKVDCVGGCKRKFAAPSSLLSHLESGFCKSGITRDKLDRAIIAEDKTNIITDLDAVLARQTRNLSLASSDISSICDGSILGTPDDSSDAASTSETFDGFPRYDPGGVSLTPGASSNEASSSAGSGVYTPGGSSTGTVTPIAGVGGGGGIPINSPPFSETSFPTMGNPYTPSTSSIASNQPVAEPTIDQLRSWLLPDGTFECPDCPDPPDTTTTKPSFLTFAELRAHMQSPTAHPQLNNLNDLNSLFLDPHDPLISTASSESGIVTPSTILTHPYLLSNGKYECPLCPLGSRRRFRSLATLQTHMLSPIAHMPKIYHCPDPELLGIALPPGTKRKTPKSFATLSALAQHVEYGACQGGNLMFKAMVGFVNEKLANLGMGDRRMIASE
ncbi:hypothetical protein HOY80DRAFT_948657 [Tuber brumale]|nr:hypothetical protein HOY80DRAFT_948657 [Tuber brumale]